MRIYPAPHYTMGGLWVDYNLETTVPGLYVDRRGQLLRPRRQPPRRLGPHAGPGRRLLRPAVHDRRLPGPAARHQAGRRPTHAAFQAAEAGVRERYRGYLDDQGHPLGRLVPPRARQDHVGLLRHGAHRAGPGEGDQRDPGPVRGVPQGPAGARRRRVAQPVARAGRPGRRLLPARPADVRGRPAARGVLRRPLPGRAPDRGGRGPAQRRRTSPSSARGSTTARCSRGTLHKEPLEFENVKLTQRSYK